MSNYDKSKQNKHLFRGLIFLILAMCLFFFNLPRLKEEGDGAMAIRVTLMVLGLIGILNLYISGKIAQRDEKLQEEEKLGEERRRAELKKRSNETKQERDEREKNEKRDNYLKLCEKKDICPSCNGVGVTLFCNTCSSNNIVIFPSKDSERQDDEIYCGDCKKAARNKYSLYESPCSECGGSGRYSRY